MAAMEAAAAADPRQLLATCKRRLAEFLQEVDDTDLVWLEEIREEAIRMFSSHYRDEPELMPKTPSQKSRQRRKRCAAPRSEETELGRKRSSQRKNSSTRPSTRSQSRNKENLELSRAETSPPQRVTRSQTAALAKIPEVPQIVLPKSPVLQERKPLSADINLSNCISAELCLQAKSPRGRQQLRGTFVMASEEHPREEDQVGRASAAPAAPETVAASSTPKADRGAEPPGTPQPHAANSTFVVSPAPGLDGSLQAPAGDEQEAAQRAQDVAGTPKGPRLSRRSVRRSLLGRAAPGRGSSAAAKRCRGSRRGSRRGSQVSASAGRVATRARPRPSAASCPDDSSSEEVPEGEGTVLTAGPSSDPCSPPRQAPQSPPVPLGPQAVGRPQQQPQEPSSPGQGGGRAGAGSPSPRMSLRSRTLGRQERPGGQEGNSNKSEKTQEPPQSARRKPSYKRAVDECYDHQQAEEGGLSPPRKKTPSPTFPASKVVKPIKTFLHTVQKNQLLMTPSSLGGSMVIKSFIRHNTPLQTDPREKERQKLQILKKKQEAEQLRKQKLEEEKKRRLDEAKLRREERQRRVQESRERALQLEQERKRRIEQKIAHFEEKTEKVREERLAEEKIRKRAAAKKLEEAEARRRQEEEARRQRALQQEEEEERRHRELMQKRKEEEQERARRVLEQRQAEQEREKQLAAQRELEKKKEQERIQAEKLREQQQKAARLQKEAQERLQEEQQKENSGACNSYQMTPHAPRAPKAFSTDPNNYGLDLNSDDSTDDESQPRKPIPAWASGEQLTQAVTRQYYNPPNVDEIFGVILSPKLEDIFCKSKPRYFKRTSSAIWSSPPCGLKPALPPSYSLKKC
ncbi:inner centromere protein isoform X2 [Melanerpes formicivorus]|uniref:inner centromere protein isoform X2 n=1 Tax=Melanerpes formicivorus TaxID=211600 RepID=UPI00358F9BEA